MSLSSLVSETGFQPRWIWRDGALREHASAVVHVSAVGHASVASVFEGLKAYWNDDLRELYVFRLDEHVARLVDSMRLVRLTNRASAAEIRAAILELLRANDTRCDVYIRPWVFARGIVREHMVPAGSDTELVVDTWAFRSAMLTERGCRAGISTWTRIADNSTPPRIKAFANYHNGRLGVIEAKQRGFDWPIFLNDRGKVTEGPGACVAMVRKGTLITPPLSAGILDSLTRDTLLTLAREEGIPVAERDVDRTELALADEAFYVGTGWEILPIVEIDGLAVGHGTMGPLTRRFDRLYHDLVRGRAAAHPEWRTAVHGAAVLA